MIAEFKPSVLQGTVDAPPSKSMAHRYMIGAALSGKECTLSGVDLSEDILATVDCLSALGVKITVNGSTVTLDPSGFMQVEDPILECRESGSTLRFFIPLTLCLGKSVTLRGSGRLFERPLDVYEQLCSRRGFTLDRGKDRITLNGRLESGDYRIRGDISSQFISGLIFALAYLNGDSTVEIIPPFESRPYVDMTLSALQSFGIDVAFTDEYMVGIRKSEAIAFSGRIEGDYSSAAFIDAFNRIGSHIRIGNLKADSLQGDRIYYDYFNHICEGVPTLDISDCPDLGPVLFALAALKNGAVFTGTDRLRLKESDRVAAMHEELSRLGGGLTLGDNTVTVPKQTLKYCGKMLDGHRDHRIVMAMSVILSKTGGAIDGAEAVKKSYPGFFDDIRRLGARIELL